MSGRDHVLLTAFPFGFTLDHNSTIVNAGRSLQRLRPDLIGSQFEDAFEVLLPNHRGPKFDQSTLTNRLCVVKIRDSKIELRGELIPVGHESMASFVGTLNVTTALAMRELGITRSDMSHHDILIDLVTLSRAHEQHVSDLADLNGRLQTAIDLKNKYQAAEHAVSKQLKLAADLRLVVQGTRVIEFQTKDSANSLVKEELQIHSDRESDTNIGIFELVPALKTVNELTSYLESDRISFSFDFEIHTKEKVLAFDGECQRLDNDSVLVLIRDITKQRDLQRNLEFRANYDQLTGLANREVLFRELSAIYNSKDQSLIDRSYLLIIDLDNFKSVNDILGHAAGDRLLQLAANRIKECVRAHDLVTRLGGDEFAVVLRNVKGNDQELNPLLERMTSYMSREVDLRGFNWSPASSVGVAPLSSATNASEILKNADLTMYDAKRAGKAGVRHYSSAIRDKVVEDIRIQHGLKQSVKNNQLDAVYQPVFDLATNSMVALESLARWQHPELGQIAPDRFIALAEKSDLIFSLTECMLRKSADTLRALSSEGLIDDSILIHVNISPSVFRIGGFDDMLHRVLDSTMMSPNRLVLEMTESVIVHDEHIVRDQLIELSKLGVSLAIDDFGKGYSSLGYLEDYPFDILKIDRQFVSHLHERSVPHRLSSAIVSLSKALDLMVIAEGIEVEGELDALREMGCQMGQGYYLAVPMTIDDLRENLASQRVVALSANGG